MIISLDQMTGTVRLMKKKHRIAVAWAQDSNTINSIYRSVLEGFTEALLVGQRAKITGLCRMNGLEPAHFNIINSEDEAASAETAVQLVKSGDADILMKGLVGTDILMKAIMDKEKGLMKTDAVLSYVGAIEIPEYHKLLFVTDPAVIPYPTLSQKIAMTGYAVEMARRFGIDNPKVALIGASEKASRHFLYSSDYASIKSMAGEGKFGKCIVDGPLDLFLACDRKSVEIKGVTTPVAGDTDILLFPSLESCNPFYKSLMLFGKGEIGGMLMGTSKPVILMSRSESERSKYFCIALACFMN